MIGFLTDIITPLASIIVFCWCCISRPTHYVCPINWHDEGVRPDGRFHCVPRPVGDPEWDGTWQRSPDRSTQPDGELCGRVYCTGGSRPIAGDDGRTVSCQR